MRRTDGAPNVIAVADIAQRIAAGDRRSIARAISALENETEDAPALRAALADRLGHAHIVGLTGAPGAGKSTLANALIGAFLGRAMKVAVVAVDPSSPVSGGALLGDRVRMVEFQTDERVFIRSLATRGHLGGLTRTTGAVLEVLDAASFDVVLVETVGTGQSEVEVAGVAHTRIVVCPPDLGDDVQALKAGVFEIADIFVLNKADRPLAARAGEVLQGMLALRRPAPWTAPLLATVATTGAGVADVCAAIERHRLWCERSRAQGGA